MDKTELHELRLWLTQNIIKQWVKQGISLEDAKLLWREIELS